MKGLSWIDSEPVDAFIRDQLTSLQVRLVSWLQAERDAGGRIVVAGYRKLLQSLTASPDLVERWETRLLDAIQALVQANHYRIGELVRENLERLDDRDLVLMLEEKVGQDLQWIRVNGAVCGFLVGVVLAAIELAT